MGIHKLTHTLTPHLSIPIVLGYVWVWALSRVYMGFKGMQGFLPIVEYTTRDTMIHGVLEK
jgi:hypothetical protein